MQSGIFLHAMHILGNVWQMGVFELKKNKNKKNTWELFTSEMSYKATSSRILKEKKKYRRM